MNARPIAVILTVAFWSWGTAAAQEPKVVLASKNENFERDVDRAALHAQKIALRKLNKLLRKNRNTPREPAFLSRLAQIYQQNASIYFRLSHASAHRKSRPINLRNFKKEMKSSISTLDRLISQYPRYPEMDRMVFMRGKAHQEIDNKRSARRDYNDLVRLHPKSPYAIPAYMALAEYAIDENKHQLATTYLHQVEKKPESPHYPFAIYKLAWAYFNLVKIPKALGYLETHVSFYDVLADPDGRLPTSDEAIRETSLMDITLFYLTGLENGLAEYQLGNALEYFKKVSKEHQRGKMYLRFVKLLRAHTREADMLAWKNQIISTESHYPESVEVVVTVYDYHLIKKQYQELRSSAFDLVKLYHLNRKEIRNGPAYAKIQKLLLNSAKDLRKLTIKNKKATQVHFLSGTLATVYDAFIKIVDNTDSRIPGVHYNLAETLFEIKDYPGATKHYRWIVKNWKRKKSEVSVQDASMKALASRYETLQNKKLIPKDLNATQFDENQDGKINPLLTQWVRWMDQHVSKYKTVDSHLQNFLFEGNRSLYAQKKIKLATKRLIRFSKKYPASKFAIPSASLAMDTYINSKNWVHTHDLATDFFKIQTWKKDPFHQRLFLVAADAFFKRVESLYASGNAAETLDLAEKFVKLQYSTSPRYEDLLFLAGKAAMDLQRTEEAEKNFSLLVKKFPNSRNTGPALLTKIGLEEKRYEFEKASDGYETYLALPSDRTEVTPKQALDIRKKILSLVWLSGRNQKLKSLSRNKSFCGSSLSEKCDLYEALSMVPKSTPSESKDAFERAIKAPKANRPIWAAVALNNQEKFGFPDRMLLVRIIAGRWNDLEPVARFALLPKLTHSIRRAFELNRGALTRYAKLKANEKSIQHRVQLMGEMEETAAKIMKLPWSRIRASVMNEIAHLYLDFSESLNGLVPPKGLSEDELAAYQETIMKLALPFDEKGHKIRSKAFEIASAFAIEQATYRHIAQPFFIANPSLAKSVRGEVDISQNLSFGYDDLERLDPDGDWDDLISDRPNYKEAPSRYLRSLWAKALRQRNWPKIAYFLQESKKEHQDINGDERRLVDDGQLGLMRTISLASAGARGEALAELQEIRGDLKAKQKSRATVILISHYLKALSKEKTKDLIEALQDQAEDNEISDFLSNDDEAFFVVYGAQWSGAEISIQNREDLLDDAAGSSVREQGKWAKKVLSALKDKEKKRKVASS